MTRSLIIVTALMLAIAAEARRALDAEVLAGLDGIARLCGMLKTRLETP